MNDVALFQYRTEYNGEVGSQGEELIADYLSKTGVNFLREVKFDRLKFVTFDFFIPEYRLTIEFDGRQHFEVVDDFGDNELKLIARRRFDKIKNRFIFGNNGRMIRVKYTEDIISVLKTKIEKHFGNDCKLLIDYVVL